MGLKETPANRTGMTITTLTIAGSFRLPGNTLYTPAGIVDSPSASSDQACSNPI